MALILASLMLPPKTFHEFQPMGGVGVNRLCCASKALLHKLKKQANHNRSLQT
jgi:pyruvate/2-oxoglutarate dehydrogenase complex dihydrolipoamide dehydrogenase (E3) component